MYTSTHRSLSEQPYARYMKERTIKNQWPGRTAKGSCGEGGQSISRSSRGARRRISRWCGALSSRPWAPAWAPFLLLLLPCASPAGRRHSSACSWPSRADGRTEARRAWVTEHPGSRGRALPLDLHLCCCCGVVNPGHLGGFYSGEKGSRHCPALIFFHLPANASLWFCVDHMTTSW